MQTILLATTKGLELKVSTSTQFILDFTDCIKYFNLHLIFEKPDVEARVLGLYRLTPGQELVFSTTVEHVAERTTCETKIKGVLADEASSSYSGKILIRKGANGTNTFLSDAVLNLGRGTKNHSEPTLQIEADDVRASHGATTGRIDPTHLYYLTSRGLTGEEATNLLVDGFFNQELHKIINKSIAKVMANKLSLDYED